ncbi:hypothetical protein LguiA_013412 [Lonicera macranthoides]
MSFIFHQENMNLGLNFNPTATRLLDYASPFHKSSNLYHLFPSSKPSIHV